jgi:hypothetical protein
VVRVCLLFQCMTIEVKKRNIFFIVKKMFLFYYKSYVA